MKIHQVQNFVEPPIEPEIIFGLKSAPSPRLSETALYGDNAAVAVIEFVDRDVNEKGKDSGPVLKKAEEAVAAQFRHSESFKRQATRPAFSC